MILPWSLAISAWDTSKFWQKVSRYASDGKLLFVRNLADLWRGNRQYLQHRRGACYQTYKMWSTPIVCCAMSSTVRGSWPLVSGPARIVSLTSFGAKVRSEWFSCGKAEGLVDVISTTMTSGDRTAMARYRSLWRCWSRRRAGQDEMLGVGRFDCGSRSSDVSLTLIKYLSTNMTCAYSPTSVHTHDDRDCTSNNCLADIYPLYGRA